MARNERTAGHEVSITLEGTPPDQKVRELADALASAAGGRPVRIEAGETATASARLPGGSRSQATAMARALTAYLAERGIEAEVTVDGGRREITVRREIER